MVSFCRASEWPLCVLVTVECGTWSATGVILSPENGAGVSKTARGVYGAVV